MSFSEFSKNHIGQNQQTQQDIPKSNDDKAKEEYLKQKYNQLKDKNPNELMDDLFDEVARQKNAGSFDFESLLSSVEAMAPFLSAEQYANIQNLLKKIK